MGVSVSPCTCKAAKMSSKERAELKLIDDLSELWMSTHGNPRRLPNIYAQVLKKLESTKQRLVKQPEHALSYDTQVKMEEMKLSRKLTE